MPPEVVAGHKVFLVSGLHREDEEERCLDGWKVW